MKLLVLGATGGTGREVAAQALQAGHDIKVFVRDPTRLTITLDRQHVITGSVTENQDALRDAMRGRDGVISALGAGNSLTSNGLIARSLPAIVQAMTSASVRRLIFTSAYGVGETWRDVPLLPRLLMRTLLRDLYADKAAGEEILRKSGLDWTLVYPVTLTNGPRTGRWRAGERLDLHGVPRISRADVAAFLLAQATDATYVRQGVLVSG